MEFKVGDKVKIKPWEQVKNHWGIDKTNWDKFIDIHTIKIVNGDYVIVINSSYVIPIEALIKVEEPTTTPTFKHKVGDIVQIKSLDWYNANKDKYGYIEPPYTCQQSFVEGMSEYCGKQYKIKSIYIGYRLEDLSGKSIYWNWQDWMLEDSIVGDKKIIEDPYPIDSIVEIDNIKYIVKDTPKKQDNCELCDCKDSSLYCRNTTLCYCSSDNRKDGKDIYLKKLPIEVDKYAIGSTFTSNGNTYMIVESPKRTCTGCDLAIYGGCTLDKPMNFKCSANNRSDNKSVIAKKITPDNSKNLEVTDKYPIGSILEHEGKEYIVTLDPKNGDICEDCDAEYSEGNCPSVAGSEFRCCALNRLDNTNVILKLKSELPTNAISIDNEIVVIKDIPCKIISGSLCKDCAFYSNCIGSECKCGAGETYQRVNSLNTGVLSYMEPKLTYNSKPVSIITPGTDLLTQLEIANSLICEKPIKYREFGYGMTSPNESLIIKGLDKETLLQIEEIPNTTVNKEIQLESVIIEYGIL